MPYYQHGAYYHYGPVSMDQACLYYPDQGVYASMGFPQLQQYALACQAGQDMLASPMMIQSPPTPPPQFISGSPQLHYMPYFGPTYNTIIYPVTPLVGSEPVRQGSGEKAANSAVTKLAEGLQSLSVSLP